MTPIRIDLDFAARPKKLSFPGIVLLLCGLSVAYWAFSDYQNSNLQVDLLGMTLSRYANAASPGDNRASLEETLLIQAAARPLSTPWSALLNDLEVASTESNNDIALLEVAPNLAKHQVRISAEARSLPAALDYVKQLQSSSTLLYPMLEKHEVRTAQRERPVRFEVAAEWRKGDE